MINEVDENTVNPDLVHGRYLFRLEALPLNDIRALGGNDAEDDKRFATVERVSEINQGLYARRACGSRVGHGTGRRGDAGDASQPATLCHVFGRKSVYAAGEGFGRVGPCRAAAGGRGQSAAGDGADDVLVDNVLPELLANSAFAP